MNIQITRINQEQQELFLNLYNLYLYDLSEFTGDEPKDNGNFDPTNTYLYLERQELHPYFIKTNEKVIGFILVCSPPFVIEEVDYTIQELFLLKKYRGRNIAARAVELVISKLDGTVRVEQLKINKSAVRFWKKFFEHHNIGFTEMEESIEIEGLEGQHTIVSQEFVITKIK
ncbi:GNAT family N-acetyltransferase [Paenibacillus sp. GCM10028914]|uniref:GNAT family N-acetyltransferase n=1 Tax=Paenibacillus sp. GCM10028914 TaxID=3273416 RepID=UPI0036081660